MYPLLSYKIFVLDKQILDSIFQDILRLRNSYQEETMLLGIHFEGLKNIRQDIFPYLWEFCRTYRIKLILFDIPSSLRIHFYLENIPIKIGCGFIE